MKFKDFFQGSTPINGSRGKYIKLVPSGGKTCEHVTIGFLWDTTQTGPENSPCQML